jgi:hypothetical protein
MPRTRPPRQGLTGCHSCKRLHFVPCTPPQNDQFARALNAFCSLPGKNITQHESLYRLDHIGQRGRQTMPVLLLTYADIEIWLTAPTDEALKVQKLATDDAVVVLPEEKKAA